MANPIIKIRRAASAGAPATNTLAHGELAIDLKSAEPNLYIGKSDGSSVVIGGSGTFATKAYVDDKVTSVFVYKGKITSVFAAGNTSFPLNLASLSQSTGSYYSIDFDYPGNPLNDNPGTVGTDKNAVAVGWVEGALPGPLAGAYDNGANYAADAVVYYRLPDATAETLYFRSGNAGNAGYPPEATANASWTPVTGAAFKTLVVKSGDSIVKTASAWEKFDNVDVVVRGTTNEITVVGDDQVGYTVSIADDFSGRVDDLETKTQNISDSTVAGTTYIHGDVAITGAADSAAEDLGWELNEDGSGKNLVSVSGADVSSFEALADGEVKLGVEGVAKGVKVVSDLYVGSVSGASPGSTKIKGEGGSAVEIGGGAFVGQASSQTYLAARVATVADAGGAGVNGSVANIVATTVNISGHIANTNSPTSSVAHEINLNASTTKVHGILVGAGSGSEIQDFTIDGGEY